MPGPTPPPTPAVEQQIVAFIRAGGFPEVAAEAAGVPRPTYRRWVRAGRAANGDAACRHFAHAVMQAAAQARLRAELATHENKPLDWLRYGPGKQTARNPGWTGPMRVTPPKNRADVNTLDSAAARAAIDDVLTAMESYPALRIEIAGFLLSPRSSGDSANGE